MAHDSPAGDPRPRGRIGGRAALFETLMRSGLVVVDQELLEDRLKMEAAKDQQVVQQLSAGGTDPAFGDRVRPRRPKGKADHFHPLAAEDLIEASGELSIPVPEQNACVQRAVLQLPGKVAGLLDHPVAGRVGGDPGEVDRAATELDEEQDVERLEPGGLHREEVGRQDLGGMLPDELPP